MTSQPTAPADAGGQRDAMTGPVATARPPEPSTRRVGCPPRWAGRVIVAPGVIVYLGPGAAADEHAHHAIQFVWGLDGELDIELGEHRRQVRAALIPADTAHRFDAHGGRIALVLIDRSGRRGTGLQHRAVDLAGTDLTQQLATFAPPETDMTAEEAIAWCEGLITALGIDAIPAAPLAPPVAQALAYLRGEISGTPRLSSAAKHANVSPTWLTHTFSRQIGIPFRRYVLWMRIQRAVDELCRGADLTTAASHAGFSDSAHLSRVFRTNFGLAPSTLLYNTTLLGGS
ncbi:AraC family transcriptional regulator [Nocardia gipuzkoensis]|uniref:helix-turn-helix transcriptional regulator n=1 Tax=Nocardia gipuzkoensis TaxID=2749991 RepID=UPI001E61E493|nr:AraC family transcriptional regulator [Nocardia gipuzkoensis]UGT69391.1 AraC family transcriptional regulator [Nocardia gipuzkoensis]